MTGNPLDKSKLSKATFAGGCFWCMQSPFEEHEGVIETVVGYMGGEKANPTYDQVCNEATGHREVVQVVFDSSKINYEKLLGIFWHNIDPVDNEGQFCDSGQQYRSAIFYHDEQQKKLAEASRDQLIQSGAVNIIYTEILPAKTFYTAEDYHQHYSEKNSYRYSFYRSMSGRDKRLKDLWNKEK